MNIIPPSVHPVAYRMFTVICLPPPDGSFQVAGGKDVD